jgi:DNA polymerase
MTAFSARDTAFLAEMGLGPLWTLREAAAAGDGAEAEAPQDELAAQPEPAAIEQPRAAAQPQAAPVEAPAGGAWDDTAVAEAPHGAGPAADDIAGMGWEALRTAIANCTRCGACKDGRKPVFGAGAQQVRWFVAAGASTQADEEARQPMAGDTGALLDNMLAAVGLSREQDVYVTNLVKCRPASAKGGDRAPTLDEVQACRPYLERELALSGAGTVLTLGQIAANGLLGKPLAEPLAGSRNEVHSLAGVPLVATLHPGELLRRGADKALAWADLCRARAARARSG